MKFIEYVAGEWINLEHVTLVRKIVDYQVWINGKSNPIDLTPEQFERIKPHLSGSEQPQHGVRDWCLMQPQQPQQDADGWIERIPPDDAEVEIQQRNGKFKKIKARDYSWSIDDITPDPLDIVRYRYIKRETP